MGWRAPSFWWPKDGGQRGVGGTAYLLPLAAIYGAVTAHRMRQAPKYKSALPVLCVGNLTVGGAGKTPTTLAAASLLQQHHSKHVGFLLRGYGGHKAGPHRVTMDDSAIDVGDEACLYRAHGPTVISRDRVAGARQLEAAGVDCILMDDGFQNPSLAKTANLIVIDGAVGWGNGGVLPAGPLRAPLRDQMPFVSAFLIVGDGPFVAKAERLAVEANIPCFRGHIHPLIPIAQTPIAVAFAGIGRPEKFFQTLRSAGVEPANCLSFPDHHTYTEQDALKLLQLADRSQGRIVTTEKDHVRLQAAMSGSARAILAERADPLSVGAVFDDVETIHNWLDQIMV